MASLLVIFERAEARTGGRDTGVTLILMFRCASANGEQNVGNDYQCCAVRWRSMLHPTAKCARGFDGPASHMISGG